MTCAQDLLRQLSQDGVVVLPNLISKEQLKAMQVIFAQQLNQPNCNTWQGYDQTDRYRLMVDQVLALHPTFVQLAIAPLLYTMVSQYLGDDACLQEAKGWQSLPFNYDFHPLHRDEWYCTEFYQDKLPPKSLKLGCYLQDVKSGSFGYVLGSHLKSNGIEVGERFHQDAKDYAMHKIVGRAGTCFLFDPQGLHQQTYPNNEARNAVFYHYFSPHIRLAKAFIRSGRYNHMLVDISYLKGLSPHQMRFLGLERGRPLPSHLLLPSSRQQTCIIRAGLRAYNEFRYWKQRVMARLSKIT